MTTHFPNRDQPPDTPICVVEDDPTVLRAISWLLAAEGYDILGFSLPQEFLTHVSTNNVPLVVLDVWMEGMSGLEVQTRLRAISPTTKVIIMTANADPATRSQAEAGGVAAFFVKPFDTDSFVQAIAAMVGRRKPARVP
ncbi:response regulator [Verrucomicrobium spinosum]|uniref:response regulator n=1 Tax=Verrucomicrobium spinosum TaxID=2736 RepID=UPI0001745B50|nr:response regulator [Verrucomicrobium spinosum]